MLEFDHVSTAKVANTVASNMKGTVKIFCIVSWVSDDPLPVDIRRLHTTFGGCLLNHLELHGRCFILLVAKLILTWVATDTETNLWTGI